MHCDVVVKLEADRKRILAIGGNVRGTVSLKLLPAALRDGNLAPAREIFAHLKLRADPYRRRCAGQQSDSPGPPAHPILAIDLNPLDFLSRDKVDD